MLDLYQATFERRAQYFDIEHFEKTQIMEACALAGLIQELIASIEVTALALTRREAALAPLAPGGGARCESQQQGGGD